MLISVIPDLLTSDQLGRAHQLLEQAVFTDGLISGGTAEDKRNRELLPEDKRYIELLQMIETPVRQSVSFNHVAFPRYMTRPIISRYEPGMYYKEHVDNPLMGFMTARTLAPLGSNYVRSDLSMTLFLSSPEAYDGGELCFNAPTAPMRIKLPAGSAVVYPTGVRHAVSMVSRGIRHAAIFWIQTLFPNEAHRDVLIRMHHLTQLLQRSAPGSEESELAHEVFSNVYRSLAIV